ncbi:MAG: DNA-protecting protein DprA [Alphaproteobacteria bacterium]|nr:MAG: DNA-protecting protein DprA [Alphaproteobacteria bacterium]TAF13543.1 MAG: DNA-protecting protein DprA [Alphaproteobacteria bacterium]TAF40379.1 MAG: DNA-protecting protein DprA [Alphaproteobacteria bacterium]TAF77516.1 MAG: DNA-protecting protein DprA [Alphaproteobacteria bacterium]
MVLSHHEPMQHQQHNQPMVDFGMDDNEHNAHRSLASSPILDIVRLIRSENVGPMTFFELIKRYQTPAKALKALPTLAQRGGSKRKIVICSIDDAQAEIERVQNYGATFIPYGHAHYPTWLRHVPDAPPLLTALGHTHLLSMHKLVAMVGSRNASANGCRFAHQLAQQLGGMGHIVVSGLARGIDSFVHRGALATGTVAVIAGGIDYVYPKENQELYEQIRDVGVIISEVPFATVPQHRHFPARNRIIAGMTRGTIVVEATMKSGSLITARQALDYHRDVFAVPGFPMDPRSEGTNKLIQEGAMLIQKAEDVEQHIAQQSYKVEDSRYHPWMMRDGHNTHDDDETYDIERMTLMHLISHTPIAVEELMVMSGIEARIMHVLLLELELAGIIQRHVGGRVSKIYE